jgi:hypothetical protein
VLVKKDLFQLQALELEKQVILNQQNKQSHGNAFLYNDYEQPLVTLAQAKTVQSE